MPSIQITTNVKLEDERAFILKLHEVFSKCMAPAPPSNVTVNYVYSPNLSFGGSFEPAFLVSIESVMGIDTSEQNTAHSKVLFPFFEETLGVPGTRGYITFIDPKMSHMSWQSETLQTIFANRKPS